MNELTKLEIKALKSSLARIKFKIEQCVNADDIKPDFELFEELIMKLERGQKND